MRGDDSLPGRPISPWIEVVRRRDRPELGAERRADAVVVGAGMVGLTTAALLHREGLDVVVLEAGRIGQGVTGRTTAKLSSLHGLTYAGLERQHGIDTARAYAAANQAGLGIVAELVERHGIECDFRRKPNLTFTEEADELEDVHEEVEAAQRAGLAAEFTETADLPFPIRGAVRVPDQAEFHPVRYLLGLANELDSDGSRVFERSRVCEVKGGVVTTESGHRVSAGRVILATHLPILDRGGQFALVEPERSHALGVRLDGPYPQGMYLSAGKPAISLRSHPLDGEELFIVGGRSARMGTGDPAEDFLALARYARERLSVKAIDYRWSAHDYMPADDLPLVGPLWPFGGGVLFATGMRKWGLAMGAAAARILADAALERDNPWSETFDPRRLPTPAAVADLAKNGVITAAHLVGDRLRRDGSGEQLERGDGAVVDSGLGKTALYRDDAGRLHQLSARCTHLGCIVAWNRSERTWDCPCHGSRYAATGEVIDGPAIAPLEHE
ncbi:MAG: FAD-dependent oxidoreductase [Solirubrobacterales bacterium]